MFKLPTQGATLKVRFLSVGDQQHLQQLKSIVPPTSLNVEFEYLQDPEGSLNYADLKVSDFSVIAFCADISLDASKLIACCKKAAANSAFTVLLVPLSATTNNDGSDQQPLRLAQLKQLAKLVNTLVLIPSPQTTVPIEIASAIHLLLSGCSFIGVDSADIKYILTEPVGKHIKPEESFYIAQYETYTGPDDLDYVAKKLANRMNTLAQVRLDNCLGSLSIKSSISCKLNDITQAIDTIHSIICPPNATQVFGAPVLSNDDKNVSGVSIVCMAGKLELDLKTLNRLGS